MCNKMLLSYVQTVIWYEILLPMNRKVKKKGSPRLSYSGILTCIVFHYFVNMLKASAILYIKSWLSFHHWTYPVLYRCHICNKDHLL